MIEEIITPEVEEDDLLGELLDDTPAADFPLVTLFNNEEEFEQFKQQLPMQIMQLWANNDKIIHIVTPVGAGDAVKNLINTLQVFEPGTQLEQVFEQLKSIIQYSEDAEESKLRLITLKQHINIQEVLSIYQWVYNPKVNIHEEIAKSKLVIQPTMEELRILYLIDVLLTIRENNSTKVVPASMLPPAIRRGK